MINNPKIEYLRKKANSLPSSPGVYIMKNDSGKIVYIGKSKKLKNRVSSYFVDTFHGIKTQKMVSTVRDFDTILCETEIEALTLENVLIKKHSPKYNINLKDSKSYPYIKITNEDFPKILMTRERKNDRAVYLGPYSGTSIAHAAIDTVQKAFRLPVCKRVFPRDIGKERPCLYKQMGRCIAPCTGEISKGEYESLISGAKRVLQGNIKDTTDALTEEMYRMANEERFEEASRLRDTVMALKALKERQKVVSDRGSDKDVWAVASCDLCSALTLLSIRDGTLNGKNDFLFSKSELINDDTFVSFLFNYYEQNVIPREILFAYEINEDGMSIFSEYIKNASKGKCSVKKPKIGASKKLCDMAYENAREYMEKHSRESEKNDETLYRLASLLALEVLPERIEAYDISNLGDEHITAGMIVFENGSFKKSDYRKFKIAGTEKQDDYLSMKEALRRRLAHIGDGSPSLTNTPDLILIDGGAGHVNAVKDVVSSFKIDIPVFGMVKDGYHKTRAITDGDMEISIARENAVFAMIYKIQEEVHRYTVTAMHAAKRKTLKHSQLEAIKGIGPVKAKKLLARFGSLKKISEMDEKELITKGISKEDAHNIAIFFHSY